MLRQIIMNDSQTIPTSANSTSAKSSIILQAWKGALSANNSAVTLLQNPHHHARISTSCSSSYSVSKVLLREAVNLLRIACSRDPNEQHVSIILQRVTQLASKATKSVYRHGQSHEQEAIDTIYIRKDSSSLGSAMKDSSSFSLIHIELDHETFVQSSIRQGFNKLLEQHTAYIFYNIATLEEITAAVSTKNQKSCPSDVRTNTNVLNLMKTVHCLLNSTTVLGGFFKYPLLLQQQEQEEDDKHLQQQWEHTLQTVRDCAEDDFTALCIHAMVLRKIVVATTEDENHPEFARKAHILESLIQARLVSWERLGLASAGSWNSTASAA